MSEEHFGGFTHLDGEGRPVMVDVSGKQETLREAVAEGWVLMPEKVFLAVMQRGMKKGDVLKVAEIAAILGAKKTPELIPLCHAIRLDEVRVECSLDERRKAIRIEALAKACDVTGVEMEALVAVSTAALVVYDMCKGIDKGMTIEGIRLLRKSGGKSGAWFAKEIDA